MLQAAWQFVCEELATGEGYTHSIEFDMQSLLYVVLYCAYLWVPHNQVERPDVIEKTMTTFFDLHHVHKPGVSASGGYGKVQELRSRRYTAEYRWDNQVFHHWLDAMLTCLGKSRGSKLPGGLLSAPLVTPPAAWSPSEVAGYWARFLSEQGANLGAADRTWNLHRKISLNVTIPIAQQEFYSATVSASTGPQKKRDAPASNASPSKDTKRQRINPRQVVVPDPGASVDNDVSMRRRSSASQRSLSRHIPSTSIPSGNPTASSAHSTIRDGSFPRQASSSAMQTTPPLSWHLDPRPRPVVKREPEGSDSRFAAGQDMGKGRGDIVPSTSAGVDRDVSMRSRSAHTTRPPHYSALPDASSSVARKSGSAMQMSPPPLPSRRFRLAVRRVPEEGAKGGR